MHHIAIIDFQKQTAACQRRKASFSTVLENFLFCFSLLFYGSSCLLPVDADVADLLFNPKRKTRLLARISPSFDFKFRTYFLYTLQQKDIKDVKTIFFSTKSALKLY